jgi:hypothetical protein
MYRCALLAALIASLLVISTCSTRACVADDAVLERGVTRLFEVGWDTSLKAREEADQVALKIDELFPGDPRGAYAHALVLAKQRRYADSLRWIDQALAVLKTDVDAWRSKIRLAMLTKDYAGALAAMERLAALAAAEPATETELEAGRAESARFLGRMFGYLEGPVEGAVTKAQLDASQTKLVASLGAARQSAFDDGRRQVRETHSSLALEKEEAAAEEKVAAEAEQEKFLRDLAEEKEGLDPKRDSLATDREKLRDDARQEVENASEDERPLLQQLAAIQSQALLVRRQLSLSLSNLSTAQLTINNERDPFIRSQLLIQANQYSTLAARYEAELNLLERRALLINRQRALLRQRVGKAQADIAAQVADIEKELGDLDKREKRITVQEKKGTRGTSATRTSRLLDVEMTAFSTYDEFPLELEKQRVLDWFK